MLKKDLEKQVVSLKREITNLKQENSRVSTALRESSDKAVNREKVISSLNLEVNSRADNSATLMNNLNSYFKLSRVRRLCISNAKALDIILNKVVR